MSGSTSILEGSTSTEDKTDSKVFARGTGRDPNTRKKAREAIQARIGVVTQANGDLAQDIEIGQLIKGIVGLPLLVLYCLDRNVVKSGTKWLVPGNRQNPPRRLPEAGNQVRNRNSRRR